MGFLRRSTPDLETIRSDLVDQSRRVREVLAQVEGIERDIAIRFRELDERMERYDRSVRGIAEELDERIDRGNKIWRKIRASEYYEKERRDREEDEDPGLDLPFGDGEVGEGEGMQAMYPNLGFLGRPPSKAQELGKALARRIAGIG